MKVAIFLLSVVAVAMGAPTGTYFPYLYNAGVQQPFTYAHPSAGYYSYSVSTAGQPAAPIASYYHAAPLAASFYSHTPSIASNQYHAQNLAGLYSYGYASSDGQSKVEQKGYDGSVSGKFSYMDPTGKMVETTYTAGKDGFRAEGDHLPKSPAQPEIPDDVKDAYKKAMDEFEEAKNRKGPAAPMVPIPATMPIAPLFYSTYNTHAFPYGAKSAYTYTG